MQQSNHSFVLSELSQHVRFELSFYLLTMSDMDFDGVVVECGVQTAVSRRVDIERSQRRWLKRAGSV